MVGVVREEAGSFGVEGGLDAAGYFESGQDDLAEGVGHRAPDEGGGDELTPVRVDQEPLATFLLTRPTINAAALPTPALIRQSFAASVPARLA